MIANRVLIESSAIGFVDGRIGPKEAAPFRLLEYIRHKTRQNTNAVEN